MARSTSSLEGAIILPTQVVADAFGWTKNRTKRWLKGCGILRKQSGGGTYGRTYTTTALLMQHDPETVHMILARISASDRKPESWLRAV